MTLIINTNPTQKQIIFRKILTSNFVFPASNNRDIIGTNTNNNILSPDDLVGGYDDIDFNQVGDSSFIVFREKPQTQNILFTLTFTNAKQGGTDTYYMQLKRGDGTLINRYASMTGDSAENPSITGGLQSFAKGATDSFYNKLIGVNLNFTNNEGNLTVQSNSEVSLVIFQNIDVYN